MLHDHDWKFLDFVWEYMENSSKIKPTPEKAMLIAHALVDSGPEFIYWKVTEDRFAYQCLALHEGDKQVFKWLLVSSASDVMYH